MQDDGRLKLDAHEVALAEVQLTDFRSANLFQMVADRVRPGTVLDVGCGGGGMVAWLLEQGHDARGIDQHPETVAAARRFLASRGRDPERITKRALDELVGVGTTVDNVVSMDCLEHIEDDRGAFAQLTALLEPGGRLVVTVPALPAVFSPRDEDMGHYRRYVPDTLRELASGLPLRIDEVRYWNLLGVAPTFLSARILRRRMSESFRYGGVGLRRRALRAALSSWFQKVENRIRPPFGLTLIMTATRS